MGLLFAKFICDSTIDEEHKVSSPSLKRPSPVITFGTLARSNMERESSCLVTRGVEVRQWPGQLTVHWTLFPPSIMARRQCVLV